MKRFGLNFATCRDLNSQDFLRIPNFPMSSKLLCLRQATHQESSLPTNVLAGQPDLGIDLNPLFPCFAFNYILLMVPRSSKTKKRQKATVVTEINWACLSAKRSLVNDAKRGMTSWQQPTKLVFINNVRNLMESEAKNWLRFLAPFNSMYSVFHLRKKWVCIIYSAALLVPQLKEFLHFLPYARLGISSRTCHMILVVIRSTAIHLPKREGRKKNYSNVPLLF